VGAYAGQGANAYAGQGANAYTGQGANAYAGQGANANAGKGANAYAGQGYQSNAVGFASVPKPEQNLQMAGPPITAGIDMVGRPLLAAGQPIAAAVAGEAGVVSQKGGAAGWPQPGQQQYQGGAIEPPMMPMPMPRPGDRHCRPEDVAEKTAGDNAAYQRMAGQQQGGHE
jgi:hypothetical protein